MSDNNHSIFEPGDLVKKRRHGENQAGLVILRYQDESVRVMWETGTASIEIDDDLDLVASRNDRGRYLIEGKKPDE